MRGVFALTILVLAWLAPAPAQAATPAFSVHKNGTAQTIVGDTPTKLTWSTEVIDTNANFATDRFTPTIAGNYLIVVSTQCAQPGACIPAIYKNGVLYAASRQTSQTFADQSPQVTAIVNMNGSTDYVEAFATSSGTSIVGVATQTYFSGSQIEGGGGSGGGSTSNTMVPGLPDAIACTVSNPAWGKIILYGMHMPLTSSGGSFYRSQYQGGSGQTYDAIFNANGTFNGYQGIVASDCNKSIAQLYTDGQAFNFLGGGTAAAAGTSGQVQFNEGGNLQADAGLYWDNANKRLAVNGLLTGGFGAKATGGTLDWNDVTNARSGSGYSLLRGTDAANAPTTSPAYYHPFSFEYNNKDGTGNITQFAVPYGIDASLNEGMFMRGRYAGAWTGWYRFITAQPSGNVGIGTTAPGAKLEVSGAISDTINEGIVRIQGNGTSSHADLGILSNAANRYPYIQSMQTSPTTAPFLINPFGGNVGIGTNAPSHILHITGQGRSTVASWATSSDARVKEDIHTIADGLAAVDKLRPVTFRYTEEYQNGNAALGGLRRGFIAQEVEAVLPDAVTRSVEKVGNREIADFRVLGNSDFVPLLVSAVKELKAANDNLKANNDNQAAHIEELRREIELLKTAR